MLSFEKDGYSVPELPDNLSIRAKAQDLYFRSLLPIMREGHSDEAREYSGEVSREIEEGSRPDGVAPDVLAEYRG